MAGSRTGSGIPPHAWPGGSRSIQCRTSTRWARSHSSSPDSGGRGPVPVNARNLRRPVRDMAWVAAAGPLSNFVMAFVGLVLLVFTTRFESNPFIARPVAGMLRFVYRFDLGLAIFNLIPLPPLDGGHFLPYFLPRSSWPILARLQQYGPLILLLLVFSGATR